MSNENIKFRSRRSLLASAFSVAVVSSFLLATVHSQSANAEKKTDKQKTESHVLEFNGYDSYVEVGHIPFDTFEAFTVEAWVKHWHAMIVYQGKEGDPENSVWLGWGSLGWINGWESVNGRNYVHKITDLPSDDWEHIAMVFDGKNQYFFVNGKQIHKIPAPKPGPMNKKRKLLVGAQQKWKSSQLQDTQRHGSGLLASLRISKKALYIKPFKPSVKLVADEHTQLLYDMSRKDDKTLYDKSSKKRNGKVHFVTWLSRADADKRP